jgi:asparagine synthase (glutamine-hydrolysing)
LQQQVKEVLAEPDHAVFDLLDRNWAHRVSEVDPATMDPAARIGMDRLLGLYHCFDIYSPELQLS